MSAQRGEPQGTANHPSAADADSGRLNEALADYYAALEQGDEPDRQALLAAYPDLADELARFFLDREQVERWIGPLAGKTVPGGAEAPHVTGRWGHYEILEEIGRGGMGVVFKARDVRLGRVVALKTVLAGVLASDDDRQRFRREVEAAAGLDHPGIVPVYEAGEYHGQPFFAMKLVEGRSLASLLREGPLDTRPAAWLVAQIARAVDHAHRGGVLHRDLKPANVLLDADGHPHVADFGLARRLDGAASLTGSGLVGTLGYLAPEQAAGRAGRLTVAADVWALGAILYECLLSRPPFVGESPAVVLRRVMEEEPPAPLSLEPRLDRDLATVCQMCLHKEPERRYRSALELAEDLERWLASEPVRARPVGLLARLWRWCRWRPLPAALLATLAAVVLSVTVGSALAAHSFRGLAEAEREAGQEADRARRQAEAALVEAQGVRLAAQSTVALGSDQSLALLLGVEAVKRAPGALTHNALRAALDVCREERLLPIPAAHWETMAKHPAYRSAPGYPRSDSHFSADGRHLREVLRVPVIRDARTGKVLAHVPPNVAPTREYIFSTAGRFVAATSRNLRMHMERLDKKGRLVVRYTDRVVRVWDLPKGKLVGVLRGHTQRVHTVAFSPDGQRIVTASNDGTARLWDAAGARGVRVLANDTAVQAAAFSGDGRRVLTVSSRWVVRGGGYPELLGGRDVRPGWPPCEVDPGALDPTDYEYASDNEGGRHPHREPGKAPALARVWDAATGRAVAQLPMANAPADAEPAGGVFSPDGRLALVVLRGTPGRAVLWDVSADWPRAVLTDRKGAITSAHFSPDGKAILTVTGRHARLWDVAGSERDVLKGHEGLIHAACFSPDGRLVATGSEDRTCRVWDVASGEAVAVLRAGRGAGTSVAFHPDGERLVTGGGLVTRIWRLRGGAEHVRSLRGHEKIITSLQYSPDGSRLLTASEDTTARVWDPATGKQLASLRGHAPYDSFSFEYQSRRLRDRMVGPVRAAGFFPGGRRVFTLSADARLRYQVRRGEGSHDLPWTPVRVWEGAREALELPGMGRDIDLAELSVDGQRLLVAEGWPRPLGYVNGRGEAVDPPEADARRAVPPIEVRIHDAASGRVLTRLTGFTHAVQAARFSPDGRRVLTVAEERPTDRYSVLALRLWDATTEREIAGWRTEPGASRHAHAHFSPDGRRVFFDRKLFDGHTLRGICAVDVKVGGWHAMFSPDGARLIAGVGGEIYIWDAETGKQVRRFLAHKDGSVECWACSADGRLIVTGGGDQTGRVWDAVSGKELHTLAGHEGAVLRVAVRPDGREVATAAGDRTIRVWTLDLLAVARARQVRGLTTEERAVYLDEPGRDPKAE